MKYPRWACALLLAGLACMTCKVDDALDDRAWPCTTSSECGTYDGRPMTCWQNFCMPSCDPEQDTPEGHQCVLPGALLKRCQLDEAGSCAAHLNCKRTDLFGTDGLCVPTPVCSRDEDCTADPEHNTCASTILEDMVRNSVDAEVPVGNMECVKTPCGVDGSSCSPGEVCPTTIYQWPLDLPPVCLPRCDGQSICPINYACAEVNDAEGAARVCLPGLAGVRCSRDEDCLFGRCMATTAGFSVCSAPCETDAGCALLSKFGPQFWCVQGRDEKLCVTPSPFQGTHCSATKKGEDCPEEAPLCVEKGPYGFQRHWECRVPCDENGRCPARGGLPHTCLSVLGGGCYPGMFGVACKDDSECLSPFSCLEVPLDGFENYPNMEPKRCTVPCSESSDCAAVKATGSGGYCGGGYCRLRNFAGHPCELPDHCYSGVCRDGVCQD